MTIKEDLSENDSNENTPLLRLNQTTSSMGCKPYQGIQPTNEFRSTTGAGKTSFLKKLLSDPFPDSAKSFSYITKSVFCLLLWALLFAFFGPDAAPGGQLFALFMLTILSQLSGSLVALLHLPPLLGMLVCGILFETLGFFNMSGVYLTVISDIRQIALAAILLQAGLDLDPTALKRLSFIIAGLAVVPCLAETVGVAVGSYVFANLPWLWGLLIGCILSAVSPAVIIPTLYSLKEQGYGEQSGISTIVIAASSLDDVISISIFGVIIGIIFSTKRSKDNLFKQFLEGPVEAGMGIGIGIALGFVAAYFPHRKETSLILKRALVVGTAGIAVTLITPYFGYSGAGPLATITLSFIAQLLWRWQGWSENPVSDIFVVLWNLMQPLLFGLIGADLNIERIQWPMMSQALLIILSGLVARLAACFLLLVGTKLTTKEMIFINLAWLPKATVQATLGPIALETAAKMGLNQEIEYGQLALTVAVLSILITAPIGAIGILLGGPLLLEKQQITKNLGNKM